MNKFVLAMMAASSLSLIGTSAFAIDHHMAGEAAAAPTQEECLALYDGMMADVAEGDQAAHDAVLAAMDDETRVKFDACHDMIHAARHPGAAPESHADHHADGAPAAEDMPHGEHNMHEVDQPQE
tara:strand:- start:622 stop:996 length:375 start_codon:yes stop_codon:yes gene_type:complete